VADSQKGATKYLVLDGKKKKPECCTILLRDLDLSGFFGMIQALENGTLNLETENRTGKA
jgi:hypothetical protein